MTSIFGMDSPVFFCNGDCRAKVFEAGLNDHLMRAMMFRQCIGVSDKPRAAVASSQA